jgi:hypothetical protein
VTKCLMEVFPEKAADVCYVFKEQTEKVNVSSCFMLSPKHIIYAQNFLKMRFTSLNFNLFIQ